ncbi:alpha/beta fold hydrolase [Saccharospirillum sp.]|uniref:alpha/beta fold hydrolase n=1 Tax=Saccharospirillum sp. TaxID=2033801 RepID=UPI00349FD81B
MTQTQTVTLADGGTLNLRIDGPEGAPWVVMSNSVMTELSIWERQIGALSNRYQLLRYDVRGHGASSLPTCPMDFDCYGADLLAILDTCGIERCTFVGLSMGVPTGLAAYAVAPERFEGFVAVDGVARSAPGREGFWAERRETARASGLASIATVTAERWMPGEPTDSPTLKALAAMVAATPVEGFATATHALQRYDYAAVVSRLTCRFLGIFGENDGAMPEAIRKQFGDLPGAAFAEIPGAGHVPNYQNPDAFNAVLGSFLDAAASEITKETF